MPIKLVISGCCGRMGSQIATLAVADSLFAVAGALEAKGHPALGRDLGVLLGRPMLGVSVTDDVHAALRAGEVLIEFTQPRATIEHVWLARQLKRAVVIGTTGLTNDDMAHLKKAAKDIPIVISPNMSVGVNLLFELAELAARRLGLAFDVEILEAHHRAKKDAPSGTAKRLAERVAASRGQLAVTVPVHAIRAGDIVGDHQVMFAGPAERVELVHRAHSREVFAQGALRAARWVCRQPPGWYDMADVLKAGRPPRR